MEHALTDYEIQIAGPIGPVARSCLPGFITTTVPPSSVLAGTVDSTAELLSVINLLTTHGVETIDIWITGGGSG